MVRYYSDDGVVEAPVNKVWALIQAHNDPKNRIHAGIVSMSGHAQSDGSVLADVVTKGEHGNVNHQWKFTMRPPHAQIIEMVDGPMKGSWITTTYLPEGNKTRFVTVADWKIQSVFRREGVAEGLQRIHGERVRRGRAFPQDDALIAEAIGKAPAGP